jgi:nucleotide-binding universal stress UspA family protein
MFKHLLVPIDGSPTSELAVEKAIGLAKAFDSAVTVLYVVDPYPFAGVGSDFAYGQTQFLNAAKAVANDALASARKALEAAGVKVTASLVESHTAWRGILDAAETAGADLIVMGSHGRSGLEKLVLGSVAQRVLSNAKGPVLVVRAAT